MKSSVDIYSTSYERVFVFKNSNSEISIHPFSPTLVFALVYVMFVAESVDHKDNIR